MRIALVGLGYWGSRLLRNCVSICGVDNVHAVDSRIDALKSAFATYPGLQCSLNLADALEDELVTGVIVATQVEAHHAVARQALEAGRHVMVEKPLASSSEEALDLARLADSLGLTLSVGHTFLFSPRVEEVHRLVRSGAVGDVHYVTSQRLNLGLFRSDANVIWDLGPHDLSIIMHVLGETPVRAQTAARSILDSDIPDVAFMNLWFPSGVIGTINVSWMAPLKVRSMLVVGEKAMVQFDDTNAEEPVKLFDKGVDPGESPDFGSNQLTYRHGSTIAPHVRADEPLGTQVRSFLDRAAGGADRVSDGWFGVDVVRVLEALDRSWREGGVPVDVPPAELASIKPERRRA